MRRLNSAAKKVRAKVERFMVSRPITEAIDRVVSDFPEVKIGQHFTDSELNVISYALDALEREPCSNETEAPRNSGGVFGTGTGATNGQTRSEAKSA